jgi:hypothetical protein
MAGKDIKSPLSSPWEDRIAIRRSDLFCVRVASGMTTFRRIDLTRRKG